MTSEDFSHECNWDEEDSRDWLAKKLAPQLIKIGKRMQFVCKPRDLRRVEKISLIMNYPDEKFYNSIDIFLGKNNVVVCSMIRNSLSGITRKTVQKYLDLLIEVGLLKKKNLSQIHANFSKIDGVALKSQIYYDCEKNLAQRVPEVINYFEQLRHEKYLIKYHKPVRINEIQQKNI